MQIHGSFKDLHNNTIDVLIYKAGDLITYEVDDYLDSTHHFCFNGDDPVTITRECTDLFEPIISTSCTIRLLSNIWCGDLLFADGMGDIIVRVKRTTSQSEQLMFVGYVTPLTFSQDINKRNNIIDIQCRDLLGYLEDRKLSTGSTYDTVLANSTYETFTEILGKLGLFNTTNSTFIFPNEQYATRLYMDSDVAALKDLELTDTLWLGSSVDDEMSMYDILIEILKYTNSRIISVDGISYYMISNNADTTTNTFYYANTGQNITLDNTSTDLPQEDKANEQVTMDDCYNVIGVSCNIEQVDDVIVSPLDDETLDRPYTNKQLYMSEFVSDKEGSEYGDHYFLNWIIMILKTQPTHSNGIDEDDAGNYSTQWMRNWYIRYCKSNNWELYNEFEPPTDSNGNLIKQYLAASRMNDLFERAGSGLSITSSTPMNLYPTFLEVQCSPNKMTYVNPTEEANSKMTPHLYIPCPETWRYKINGSTDMTEQWAYNYINDQLEKYETTPMVKYKSNTVVNFTPPDENVTNYLVFKGKIELMASCEYDSQTVPTMGYSYRGLSIRDSFQEVVYRDQVQNLQYGLGVNIPPTYNKVFGENFPDDNGTDEDQMRWYYRVYWTKENPNQDNAYVAHMPDEHSIPSAESWVRDWSQEPNSPTFNRGIMYSLSTDGMYSKQYGWGITRIDKRNTTHVDINYVPILMCRLRIGNKYLNEIMDEGATLPRYEWTTNPANVFSLGVNLKRPDDLSGEPKDFLIGTANDIYNNITVGMNLQKETKGLAIPIHYSDKLRGDLEFQIVGPYNATLESHNHYYKHSTWFRGSSESWTQNDDVCILNHVHAIDITDFQVVADTDNAKVNITNSGDLYYYSEDNRKYDNPKDDIEFKIVSGLSSDEAATLNITTGISYNNPTNQDGSLYIPETKQEEKYIQTMYDLYSTPKKIIEYDAKYGENNITDMYRTVYSCDIMTDLDVQNFNSIIIGDEIDLKNDRIKIKTREL